MKRCISSFSLLILLWLGAACNFPTTTSLPNQARVQVDLQQTLSALSDTSPLSETPAAQSTPASLPAVPPSVDPTPTPAVTPVVVLPPTPTAGDPGVVYAYTARSGDTLQGLAGRFGVQPDQISSQEPIPAQGFITSGQNLQIPNVLEQVSPAVLLLPDSELVYSPASLPFDLAGIIENAGGYLSTYQEVVDDQSLSGTEILEKVARELSVNPLLLLGILEFRSQWAFGQPVDPTRVANPIGFYIPGRSGLYQELSITATQLNLAYYGWREGTFTQIKFSNGATQRLSPELNAASAALQHLFSLLIWQPRWQETLYGEDGFAAGYQQMFGNPWERAAAVGDLFPAGLAQPEMVLPFLPGERWGLTAGPHNAWNAGTPRGALDFSPVTSEAICAVSRTWVTASAPGLVLRAADNMVVLDLDGDGYEQTGWVVLYYHLAEAGMISPGTQVERDDPLGHPSCEGGRATGKHVHIARKYNGEWLEADGALPFVLSGWQAQADERNYYGFLVKGDQMVSADPSGGRTSSIVREAEPGE